MNKYTVSFLFLALLLSGCQENVQTSTSSESELVDESSVVVPVSDGVIEDVIEDVVEPAVEEPSGEKVLEVSEDEPKAIEKPLSPAEKLTLHLIEQGETALAAERLLTPEEDNANMYFQAALGRDPGNFRAIQGITAIVDTYTQWAWIAAKRRDYKKAARYLDFARSASPEDSTIIEMTSRIEDYKVSRAVQRSRQAKKEKPVVKNAKDITEKEKQIAGSESQDQTLKKEKLEVLEEEDEIVTDGRYFLPKSLFSLSEDEIIAKIQPIIDEVAATNSELAIYWPKDKEARLIYQIINSRIEAFRVRAMIYHRSDYMVELQQE